MVVVVIFNSVVPRSAGKQWAAETIQDLVLKVKLR